MIRLFNRLVRSDKRQIVILSSILARVPTASELASLGGLWGPAGVGNKLATAAKAAAVARSCAATASEIRGKFEALYPMIGELDGFLHLCRQDIVLHVWVNY